MTTKATDKLLFALGNETWTRRVLSEGRARSSYTLITTGTVSSRNWSMTNEHGMTRFYSLFVAMPLFSARFSTESGQVLGDQTTV